MSTHLKLQAWGEQCGCSSNVWRAVRLLLQGSWHGLSVHYSSKVCSVAVKIRAKVEEIVKRLTMREEEVAAMQKRILDEDRVVKRLRHMMQTSMLLRTDLECYEELRAKHFFLSRKSDSTTRMHQVAAKARPYFQAFVRKREEEALFK